VEQVEWSEAIEERLAEREARRADLRSTMAALEGRLAQTAIRISDADLEELSEGLGQALATGPPEEARRLLGSCIEEIEADREQAVVRYRFPFGVASWL
jgi:hypothetical protein